MKQSQPQTILKLFTTLIVLAAAGVSPNLFVAAQAGIAPLSRLAVLLLIPSVILIGLVILFNRWMRFTTLNRQILTGFTAGIAGTVGLEVVRQIGFRLGGMPGDMPRLLGVLLMDRFALGPNLLSDLAGYAYHFWNGAAFGIVFVLLLGQGGIRSGLVYAILVGIGFMASPVVVALGVGYFGRDFGWGFPATVLLAHIAFGLILGTVSGHLKTDAPSLLARWKAVLHARS